MTRSSLLSASLLTVLACKPTTPTADAGSGVVPDAPTGVQATLQTAAAHVQWTASGGGQTQFVIGRAIVAAAMAQPAQTELQVIGSAGADATAYDDLDLEPGHFYVYGVAARNASGRSDFTVQEGSVTLTPMASPCAKTITATDSDGDGLSDADENAGWTVIVDETGTGVTTTRTVRSSPFAADTDGDGVCDSEESSLKLDPRQADTDGDGLTDYAELNKWGSSPTSVDSDMDSSGNSAFYDGAELLNYGTSPTLADTDGDGRTDFEEVNQNGTNPLAADVPQPRLEVVSAMDLGVDVQTSTGTTMSNAVMHSFEQGTSNTLGNTSSTANTSSTESSYEVSAEASVGYPASASVKATGTYSAKEGYVQETSSSLSRQAQTSSEQTYEALSTELVSKQETVTGGHLGLDFQVSNHGTRSFQLSNVVVTALRRDRANPTQFTSIATLNFPATADSLVLAEGQSTGPIRAQADIAGNVALDLLSNPGSVFFRTANFNLTDKTGTNFAFSVGETTSSRTALLTIDYGGVRPLERYRVATNVERTSDGKAAGVRLGDALSRIIGLAPGVGYATTVRANTGKRVITRVRDVGTTSQPDGGVDRFWVVIAPENPDSNLMAVTDRLLSKTVDVDDAVLMPRDSLTLAYVADHDGDGLYEREELTYGTYDGQADSDGDGLTDFEEVRQGWTVAVDNAFYRANPRVYSNPTAVDADGDGWNDATEKLNGTDPNRKDTDGDGLIDSIDPAPTKGPSGTWVKVLGTAGDEAALQVLADADTVWVLGTSTGDIDGDSVSGGPFVMALDSATGTKKWAVQLEGTTNYARHVVLNAAGTVGWVTELQGNVVPGAATHAIYMVKITKAGAVTATELTNTPYNGATTLANQSLSAAERGVNGGMITVGGQVQANSNHAITAAVYDGNFNYSTSVTYGGQASPIPQVNESSSNGVLTVTSEQTGAACSVNFYRLAAFTGSVPYCTGGHPDKAGKVALDHQSAAYVQAMAASKDTLDRISLSGQTVWTRTFAPTFMSPRITGLDVDDSDHLFVGLQDSSSALGAGLEVLLSDQTRAGLYRLGNATTRLVSSKRDPIGNLFNAGTTTGGFETYAPNNGGTDIVLTRNPQISFAP